jgi:hypothetical protein
MLANEFIPYIRGLKILTPTGGLLIKNTIVG